MKKLYSLLLTVTISTLSLFAQAPHKMSYQAIIRDSENQLVVNSEIGMRISILQGSVFGASVYIETLTPETNANGLVTVEIGSDDVTVVTGNLSQIDWSDGPYFIKTETDPSGGTGYTITGTSQLLSVPYAMHSGSSDVLMGDISESQISDLQDYLTQETDPLFSAWDKSEGIIITESQISDLKQYLREETDPSVPAGIQTGEMQYWNGTAWVTVAPGNEGQVLALSNGVPTWLSIIGDATTGGSFDVYNPQTGKIWMDRNLGASQAATSSTDGDAYGHLYQWGRGPDGHQIRTSPTSSTLSNSDTPGHKNFILAPDSPHDWRSSQNDNLWQGVNGTNNPCPAGYRLPTAVELDAERQSWSSNNASGAFASPLKLSVAGFRTYGDGSLWHVGSRGFYSSSTVDGTLLRFLFFRDSDAYMVNERRAGGLSVRCIRE
jgi:hypothetical protein